LPIANLSLLNISLDIPRNIRQSGLKKRFACSIKTYMKQLCGTVHKDHDSALDIFHPHTCLFADMKPLRSRSKSRTPLCTSSRSAMAIAAVEMKHLIEAVALNLSVLHS
jgi:hypothetical protein